MATTYPSSDISLTLDTDNDNFKLKTFNDAFNEIQNHINGTRTKMSSLDSSITSLNNKTSKLSDDGSTYTGKVNCPSGLYGTKDEVRYGINLNNSDIIGVNGFFTKDSAGGYSEGINFYRDITHNDSMYAAGGHFYFGANVETLQSKQSDTTGSDNSDGILHAKEFIGKHCSVWKGERPNADSNKEQVITLTNPSFPSPYTPSNGEMITFVLSSTEPDTVSSYNDVSVFVKFNGSSTKYPVWNNGWGSDFEGGSAFHNKSAIPRNTLIIGYISENRLHIMPTFNFFYNDSPVGTGNRFFYMNCAATNGNTYSALPQQALLYIEYGSSYSSGSVNWGFFFGNQYFVRQVIYNGSTISSGNYNIPAGMYLAQFDTSKVYIYPNGFSEKNHSHTEAEWKNWTNFNGNGGNDWENLKMLAHSITRGSMSDGGESSFTTYNITGLNGSSPAGVKIRFA